MKSSLFHVVVQKELRCKKRNFELSHGALIFLQDASTPMLEFLQEVFLNDAEALYGDTDVLMKRQTSLTSPKEAWNVSS